MSLQKRQQKTLKDQAANPSILNKFKATTGLAKALYATNSYKSAQSSQARQEFGDGGYDQLSIQQQVAALCSYKPPKQNEKIAKTVEQLVHRRRQRHNQTLDEYQRKQKQILGDIKTNFRVSQNNIEQYLQQIRSDLAQHFNEVQTHDYLLARQKDFLQEIQQAVTLNLDSSSARLESFGLQIKNLEGQSYKKIEASCQTLFKLLFEIAFLLEGQINQLINEKRVFFNKQVANIVKQAGDFQQRLKESSKQIQKSTKQRKQKVQGLWKTLHHNKIYEQAQKELTSDQFNYDQRMSALFNEIGDKLSSGHAFHKKVLQEYLSAELLPKSVNQVMIESEQDNSKLQLAYDKLFQTVVKQLKLVQEKVAARLARMTKQLNWVECKSTEQNQVILNGLADKVKAIREVQTTRIKAGLAWTQKYDNKGMQTLNNIGKFILNIANKRAEHLKNYELLNKNYEIEKAKLQDEDEQRIQNLNKDLQHLKNLLKNSLHHIKLQENLKPCFDKVDQIQQALRLFHSQNEKLAGKHPTMIKSFYLQSLNDLAKLFQLYTESQRAKILQKKKKEAEELIVKIIQFQQKKKAAQLQKQNDQIKKKGGKAPPPPKPKDPKKAAQQFQERKAQLLKQSKYDQLEIVKGYLSAQSLEQIVSKFYISQQQTAAPAPQYSDQPKDSADKVDSPPNDIKGRPLFRTDILFALAQLVKAMTKKRDQILDDCKKQEQQQLQIAKGRDKLFLQKSIEQLDKRIKNNYPLKGLIQNQIYQPRSSEITAHKKKYQRHVRRQNQQLDLQTQKFNFYLEEAMNCMKKFNAQQKTLKESLTSAKNLPALNSLQTDQKQQVIELTNKIQQYIKILRQIAGSQLQILHQSNQAFLKECKLPPAGNYSQEQIQWYKSMMAEMNKIIDTQKSKRKQKIDELQAYFKKKRTESDQYFNKEFTVLIEQMAAKDGNGKKYAKPKRLAHEKIRVQMDKCERAQAFLKEQMESLKTLLNSSDSDKRFHLNLRDKLISIRMCFGRYGRHLQAFRPDAKFIDLPKISLNQNKFQTILAATQQEEYKARVAAYIDKTGPLAKQKQQTKFQNAVNDIDKLTRQQTQKIYVGDKAKYLTGADKIPDWLRTFLTQIRKQMQSFRIAAVRELRRLCLELVGLSQNISKQLLTYIKKTFGMSKDLQKASLLKQLQEELEKNNNLRADHLKRLRPNLRNPFCKQQLQALLKLQSERSQRVQKVLKSMKERLQEGLFKQDNQFFKHLINNWQFLQIYFDCLLLAQDFIKLPGDEVVQKKHKNLLEILKAKEQGIPIQSDSQRLIQITWEGLLVSTFDLPPHKTQFIKEVPAEQPSKDKKAAKKQTKNDKSPPVETQPKTQQLKTFKTEKHSMTFLLRNELCKTHKSQCEEQRSEILGKLRREEQKQAGFKMKWERAVLDLTEAR